MLFLVGSGALIRALARVRLGHRQSLYRLFFLLLLAAAGVLGLEGVLRLYPEILHGRVANYTFGGYHVERSGIYRRDRHLGLAMKTNFRRRLFWNGHWWSHETNAQGYRGPGIAQADAVFLGDSMIYGHGVEQDATVPASAGRLGGFTVANLGQPGTGILQALALFEEKGVPLRPRQVFICFHHNDAEDTADVYREEDLEAWLRDPRSRPLARPELRDSPTSSVFDDWADHVAIPLFGARMISALRGKPDWVLRAPAPGEGESEDDKPYIPGPVLRDAPYAPIESQGDPRLRLGFRANRAALGELRRVTREAGADLVVFDLGYPKAFSEAVEALAGETGALYCPAGRIALSRAVASDPIYLPRDGHWTGRGAEVVARELLRCAPSLGARP